MTLGNSCILTAEIDFVRVEQGDEQQRVKKGTRVNLNNHWGVLIYKRGQKPIQTGGKLYGQGEEENDKDSECGTTKPDYL